MARRLLRPVPMVAPIKLASTACTLSESGSIGVSSVASAPSELTSDAFVHEGITTGLKGGRLHLDDEDLETMQDSIDNRSLVNNSNSFRSAAKFATAPINLAVSDAHILADLGLSAAGMPFDQQGFDRPGSEETTTCKCWSRQGCLGVTRGMLGGIRFHTQHVASTDILNAR